MRIQNGAAFTINFIINAIRPKKCHPPWKKSYEKSKAQAPVPPSTPLKTKNSWNAVSNPQTDPRIQCSGKSTN